MLPPPAGHGDLSALLVDVDALAGDERAAEPADAVRPPGVPHVDVPVPAAGQELLGVGGVVHWQWVKIEIQRKCSIKYLNYCCIQLEANAFLILSHLIT